MKRRKPSTCYKATAGNAKSDNGPLFARRPADYANGDRECRSWGDRIDITICIIRSEREPARCAGCKYGVNP